MAACLDYPRLTWNAERAAVEYHVYRGALASLGYANFGACRDELDPNRTDLQLDDAELPAPGTGFFYLVTAESGSGNEGSAGEATCTERSRFSACPTNLRDTRSVPDRGPDRIRGRGLR